MKKSFWIIPISLLIIGLVAGFFLRPVIIKSNNICRLLKIIGDVKELQKISSFNELSGIEKIDVNGISLKAVKLEKLISKSNPVSNSNKILFIGNDSLAASIDWEDIEECFITYSMENGWEAINMDRPIASNVKNLVEIVISSKDNTWEYGFNIVKLDANILNITPGQMYLKAANIYNYEGSPSVNKDNKTFTADIYRIKKEITLEDLLKKSETSANSSNLLLMGQNGDFGYLESDGYFELKDNYINYVYPNSRNSIEKVAGIMLDAPSMSIMDSYYDSKHFIEKNEKVLLVLVDGFSYQQYLNAVENNFAPFLAGINKAEPAVSVYQPVSNSGLAAIITGTAPAENGIYSRKQRELKVQTIFGDIQDLGKKALLVEGDVQIIKIEIEPMLNVDRNNDGMRDDEIFESAFKNLNEGYDFLMVHFHAVDEKGQDYGTMSEDTMEAISMIDNYINLLAKSWQGKIILTSDHGMHDTEDGGSHGDFRFEDLIVPYLLFEGGN